MELETFWRCFLSPSPARSLLQAPKHLCIDDSMARILYLILLNTRFDDRSRQCNKWKKKKNAASWVWRP